MQRFAVLFLVCLSSLVIFAGCGGGKASSTVGAPASITVTPSAVTVEYGRFVSLVATVKDANGAAVNSATVTWSSSNPAVAQVTTGGAVCGGQWNSLTAPTACTALNVQGTVTITATTGTISGTATVTVVPHIARIDVAPLGVSCVSQTQTAQFSAVAKDSAGNVIPTTPASFTWVAADSSVATVDANGLVTAKRPGGTTINASIAGTNGIAQGFATCPPQTITLGTTGVTPLETSFSLAAAGTKNLTATVTDTMGNPITDLLLTFNTLNAGIASTPLGANAALAANVTGVAPGVTTIVASCTPQSCNPSANQPYYSNPVTVTVTGTSSTKTVIAGTTATSVVVVDGNNAASAPIALPTIGSATPVPNSIIIGPDGAIAYIGTNLGILRFDLNTNTFLSSGGFDSHVLAVSPNGSKVIASDLTTNAYVLDLGANSVQTFPAAGVTSADFSTDNLKAMLVAGTNLFVYSSGATTLSTFPPLGASAQNIRFLAQSSVALAAEGGQGQLLSNCKNAPFATTGATGTLLAKPNTSARLWGADGSNIYQVAFSGTFAASSTPSVIDCTPNVSASSAAKALGASVTAKQLVATPDGLRAFLVNSSSTLYGYKVGDASVTPITLIGGGSPVSAGITPDSATMWVGATTFDIHRFDLTTGAEVQILAVGLKKSDGTSAVPDLIATRTR